MAAAHHRFVKTLVRLNRLLRDVHLKRQISTPQPTLRKNILYSAICVERLPILTTPKNRIEQNFSNIMTQIEVENSVLSDHEVRLNKESQAAQRKKETQEEEGNPDAETETALDLEDKWENEMKTFVPSSRLTEADEKNELKSTERRLGSSLYLLVKQNIEGRDHWVLPQATWLDGETLRETAERALASVCGELKVNVLGNAPCAVAKYEPPSADDGRGIKIFFFKAWYRTGDVTTNKEFASDFVWVTKEELDQYCLRGYQKSLKKFII